MNQELICDLSVTYLGLKLKNPIIIGSCGLTGNIAGLKRFEEYGAGAVVLKSIFEEQILREAEFKLEEIKADKLLYSQMSETLDYLDHHVKEENVLKYIELIKEAKAELSIPVIASVNCISDYGWTDFITKIEDAGADAIELNIFFHPVEAQRKDSTAKYTKILNEVKKKTKLPIVIKLNSNYSNIGNTVYSLDDAGVDALVLFNRFYTPDIDIETLEVVRTRKFSREEEYALPLQWIAFSSEKVNCELIANTGIFTGETIIKQLLVGATAVEVVSAMYEIGPEFLITMLRTIEDWMRANDYPDIESFRGKLAYREGEDSAFDRMQYMKYFSKPNI